MAWNDLILKPEVEFIPTRTNAAGEYTHAIFKFKITFVGDAYPVLEHTYDKDVRISAFEANPEKLTLKIKDLAKDWKEHHDYINSKQAIIETELLNTTWGAN